MCLSSSTTISEHGTRSTTDYVRFLGALRYYYEDLPNRYLFYVQFNEEFSEYSYLFWLVD